MLKIELRTTNIIIVYMTRDVANANDDRGIYILMDAIRMTNSMEIMDILFDDRKHRSIFLYTAPKIKNRMNAPNAPKSRYDSATAVVPSPYG